MLSYTICKDCRVKLRPQYCMVSRKRADSRPVAVMCIRAAPGSEEHRLSRSRGHSGGGPNHRRCRCARRAPHSCFGQARTALSGCARSGCHHHSQHVLADASCKVPLLRHSSAENLSHILKAQPQGHLTCLCPGSLHRQACEGPKASHLIIFLLLVSLSSSNLRSSLLCEFLRGFAGKLCPC